MLVIGSDYILYELSFCASEQKWFIYPLKVSLAAWRDVMPCCLPALCFENRKFPLIRVWQIKYWKPPPARECLVILNSKHFLHRHSMSLIASQSSFSPAAWLEPRVKFQVPSNKNYVVAKKLSLFFSENLLQYQERVLMQFAFLIWV